MIIYGSKATEIAREQIRGNCSNCGTSDSLMMLVFQRYAHIFWVPFFPIGKTGVTQCSHCKQVLRKKEFGENLQQKFATLKSKTRAPIWTFIGLISLTILILFIIYSVRQKDAQNAKLILAPQHGDVYEVKLDYKQYTLYMVDHVEGDSVFLLVSQYESNKKIGLRDLKYKGAQGYSRGFLGLEKRDLKNMLDKGDILDIDR